MAGGRHLSLLLLLYGSWKMALPDDWETHPRVWPDRDTVIQRACDSLQARKHVIVAGDILLDRRTIISDIVSRLRDVGVAVLDTSASETVTCPVSPGTVVVVDLGIMTRHCYVRSSMITPKATSRRSRRLVATRALSRTKLSPKFRPRYCRPRASSLPSPVSVGGGCVVLSTAMPLIS